MNSMPTSTSVEPESARIATRLRDLADKTQNAEVAETLRSAAGILDVDRAAWEGLSHALDAATVRKRGLLGRIRAAIAAGPEVVTEFDLLEETAQWCEAVAGVAQDVR
jgi:hypothetical protein